MRHLRLLAAVVLATTWWAAPQPALAANDCTGVVICLYENANQQGCRYGVSRAIGDLKKERFSDCPKKDVNDKISSFSNPTDYHWAVLHEDTFSKGAIFCVRPSATGNIPGEFNDKASGISRTENAVPRGC
jgi:hypothetical protein